MPNHLIDPAVYGGTTATGPVATPVIPKPAQVGIEAAAESPQLEAEGVARAAWYNRDKATAAESMRAAAGEWIPNRMYQAATAPTFASDPTHNGAEYVKYVKEPLSMEERDFIADSTSPDQAKWKLDNIMDKRHAASVVADNPWLGGVVGFLDPAFIGASVLSGGGAAAARIAKAGLMAQRAAAAATATGVFVGVGKVEQTLTPMSEASVYGQALAFGALEGALFRGGKLVKADEGFPSKRLNQIAEDISSRGEEAGTQAAIKAEAEQVMPRVIPEPVPEVPGQVLAYGSGGSVGPGKRGAYIESSGRAMLKELSGDADPMVGKLADHLDSMMLDDVAVREVDKSKLLDGTRPFYDPNHAAVYIAKDTPSFIKLHEITHALTEHKLMYGLKNPETAHGVIAKDIVDLIEHVKANVTADQAVNGTTKYFLSNPSEFIAGLFSGKSEFIDLLHSIKAPDGATSVLSKLVDSVRKILGMAPNDVNSLTHAMGLTDKLLGEKLNTTFIRPKTGEPVMSVRAAPARNITLEESVRQVEKVMANDTAVNATGRKLEHSLRKTIANMPGGEKIAGLFVDDALNFKGDSVTSQRVAIRRDFATAQYVFSDVLADTMAERGAGIWNRIFHPGKSGAIQSELEQGIKLELLHREAGDGIKTTDMAIKDLADKHQAVMDMAAKERTASGELGAATLKPRDGYFTRMWDFDKINGVVQHLVGKGLTERAAKDKIIDAITIGISRANGYDAELSRDMAQAIYDRTVSKGMFDSAGMSNTADGIETIRTTMQAAGVPDHRIEKAIEKLVGQKDEANVERTLKNRIKMDMFEPITDQHNLHDLIGGNMNTMLDKYLDRASATAAMARKGIVRNSDLQALRKEFIGSQADDTGRRKAAELFDNTISSLRGEPVGEGFNDFMRGTMAFNQLIGLKMTGMFQFTEYVTLMKEFGFGRVMKEVVKELGFIRNVADSESLRNVLARNINQDMRLMPFVSRLENNMELPQSAHLTNAMQQAKQLVPYMNASKWIMAHQARIAGNLMADTILRAAKGEEKALHVLGQYGLESPLLDRVKADIVNHGVDTTKWSQSSWEAIRAPIGKMTDDMVLKGRLGELPAWFQFSTVGQFLGTFRSFLFAAHNKVLAGTLHRDGAAGLSLLMLYQLPLTYAVAAANNVISGKPDQDVAQTMKQAFGQMSSVGLFSELFDAAFNGKTKMGTPGTMSIDKAYNIVSQIGKGDAAGIAKSGIGAIPLLNAFPGMKAIGFAFPPTDKKEGK